MRQESLFFNHSFDVGVQTFLDLLEIGICFVLLDLFVIMDLVKFASFILVNQKIAMNLLIIIIRNSLYLA